MVSCEQGDGHYSIRNHRHWRDFSCGFGWHFDGHRSPNDRLPDFKFPDHGYHVTHRDSFVLRLHCFLQRRAGCNFGLVRQVRPTPAMLDMIDRTLRYSALLGNLAKRKSVSQFLTDGSHFTFGEASVRMFFSARQAFRNAMAPMVIASGIQSHSFSVGLVLGFRQVFEVIRSIVSLVCVLMVDLVFGRRVVADEGGSDELMNVGRVSLVVFPQLDTRIGMVIVDSGKSSDLSATTANAATDSAQTRNLVFRKCGDDAPFFGLNFLFGEDRIDLCHVTSVIGDVAGQRVSSTSGPSYF